MRTFIITLLLLVVIISLIILFISPYLFENDKEVLWVHITHWFYATISLFLFLLSSVGFKKSDSALFVKILGLNTFLRLLFSLGFTVILLITNDLKTLSYISANILLYFTYLAFEIRFLLTNLRPDSKERADVGNANK